jgi:hypothetical protein
VAREPAGGRNLTVAHRQQRGFVDLDQDGRLRQPTAQVGPQQRGPLSQGLGQLPPGPMVGQQPVAGGPLHARGQRPRAADGHLQRPAEPLEQFLGIIEIAPPLGSRPAVLRPGVVRQPPARRLNVEAQPVDESQGPSDEVGAGAPRR